MRAAVTLITLGALCLTPGLIKHLTGQPFTTNGVTVLGVILVLTGITTAANADHQMTRQEHAQMEAAWTEATR